MIRARCLVCGLIYNPMNSSGKIPCPNCKKEDKEKQTTELFVPPNNLKVESFNIQSMQSFQETMEEQRQEAKDKGSLKIYNISKYKISLPKYMGKITVRELSQVSSMDKPCEEILCGSKEKCSLSPLSIYEIGPSAVKAAPAKNRFEYPIQDMTGDDICQDIRDKL